MIFTDIRLQNFRSYKDASFDLSESVTIVVGPNTAGKTNLLEGVLVAAKGKSYRATTKDLINHEQSWARIDIHTTENQQRTIKITAEGDLAKKSFEIDGKEYKRLPFFAQQPVVLFEPNSPRLLEGDPSRRRAYLDDLLSQTYPLFSKTLAGYKRALAQRNSLLKQKTNKDIFIWDVKLSQLGEEITKNRLELLNKINKLLQKTYSSIAETDKKISTEYTSKINLGNYGSSMLNFLQKTTNNDLERGYTGAGPHRDDLTFLINNKPASLSASRGEMRTIILALKSIELGLLAEARGVAPILLLDDVFSELDGARRKALTDLVKDHQTIITTTDADIVNKSFSKKALLITI